MSRQILLSVEYFLIEPKKKEVFIRDLGNLTKFGAGRKNIDNESIEWINHNANNPVLAYNC